MSSAIDGLISGLDTTSLISSLMKVEAAPQTQLKAKQATSESMVTALQALNTKIASLAEIAGTAAKGTSWQAFSATSSATSATATAGATAQAGSISFAVDQVATSQVSLSRIAADDGTLVPSIPPAVTVKKADGTFVTVEPTTGSLADIAKAINDAADAGVRATVVRVSNGTTAEYRIQFTGTTTGTDGAFEVFAGTQAEVEAAITAGTEDSLQLDGNTVRAAQNAKITLWRDNPTLAQTFEQSSNTFSGLMTGVDVTVSAVTAADEDPVTITVGQDGEALSALASNLVGALGVALSEIASRTKATTSTAADGGTLTKGGLFSADSTIRNLQQGLVRAASMPADGFSPAEVGITLATDGTFAFDAEKFAAALAADPAKVQSMVATLAQRVADVATSASSSTTGTLTSKITGQQSAVRDLGLQIDNWDTRLALRQAALEKTYAALEVSLSNLNAQSSWLTSALESLSTSTSS